MLKLLIREQDYYKGRLTCTEQAIYDQILCGARNYVDRIVVSKIESGNYEKVMHAVLMDHPRLFHFNSGNISFDGKNLSFLPNYICSGAEYREQLVESVDEIKMIVEQMKGKQIHEALQCLHSELMASIQYQDNGIATHNIVGPLLRGIGVCEGIAKTVKAICDEAAIPCLVIEGTAYQGKKHKERHAWNAIYANREWHFYDFTFDITMQNSNPCKSIDRYDYFCILRSEMERDHFDWSASITDEGNRKDFFSENNLYINNKNEMINRITQSGKKDFAYKIDDSWKKFDADKTVSSVMNDYVKFQNKICEYTYSYNDVQRVIYIHIN